MEREQYEDIGLWLREYVGYLPDAEVSVRAAQKMKEIGIFLPEVYNVLATGRVLVADRDYDGCHFIVRGRSCDGKEVTIKGRFEAASTFVAIDDLT